MSVIASPILILSTVCTARVDLGFLVDVTSTVVRSGRRNFQRVIRFVRETVRRFTVSTRAARIGVVTYASRTKPIIGFAGSNARGRIYSAIRRIRGMRGGRRLGRALYYVRRYLFTGKPRCGRRRVLIVLTAGRSIDRVRRPAVALQGAGVEIFMIGVGRVGSRSLVRVTTDRRHVFVLGFAQLYTIVKTVKDRICFSPGKFALHFWQEMLLACAISLFSGVFEIPPSEFSIIKRGLLVNFRPVIYFVDSNDLYKLERLLVSFNSVFI